MPRNSKPRKQYRPRASIYPNLHDVGLIFRPIHRLFDQLRSGQVDSVKGKLVFTDWLGGLCEVVPALEGWIGCWERVAKGEGIEVKMDALRRLYKRLKFDVPLTIEEVNEAWEEILVTQRLTMRIPRKTMGSYMRTEQIAIEMDIRGLRDAA